MLQVASFGEGKGQVVSPVFHRSEGIETNRTDGGGDGNVADVKVLDFWISIRLWIIISFQTEGIIRDFVQSFSDDDRTNLAGVERIFANPVRFKPIGVVRPGLLALNRQAAPDAQRPAFARDCLGLQAEGKCRQEEQEEGGDMFECFHCGRILCKK